MYALVWSLRSDRLPLYKLQESAKNVCFSTKMPSASGGFPWPRWGLCPWTPAGGSASDPVISSRSRARHMQPITLLFPNFNSNYLRRPSSVCWNYCFRKFFSLVQQLKVFERSAFFQLSSCLRCTINCLITNVLPVTVAATVSLCTVKTHTWSHELDAELLMQ